MVLNNRRTFLSLFGSAVPFALSSKLRAFPLGIPEASSIIGMDINLEHQAQVIHSGPLALDYIELGNIHGEPLLLVHGFPDGPVAWTGVLANLDLTTFRVILPFLRGYGRSGVQDPELITGQSAALATDLLALVDNLSIPKFHLVGHDWGAKASYAVTVLMPERVLSLTTLATAYVIWKGQQYPPAQIHGNWYQFYFQTRDAQKMLDDHRAEFCKELWRTWSPTYNFTDTEFAAAANAWNNPQFTATVLNYYRVRWGGAATNPRYDTQQKVIDMKPAPAITRPTLFIQGAADACDLPQGADGQESYFRNGYKRVVIPGVGHFPHRENPAAVAMAIADHLKSNR